MTAPPDWMRPPRPDGWFADDLDNLPEAPRHTELIDGALVFMTTPQRSWHARVVTGLTTAPYAPDRTWCEPGDVPLAAEVVSAESAHRDQKVKLRKYAEAGIAHYWLIDEEDRQPVVHVYELDEPTGSYVAAGIFRGTLDRPVPFPITLDLSKLVRR